MEVKRAVTVAAQAGEDARGTTIRWLWSTSDGAPTFALRLVEVQPGGSSPFRSHNYEHEVYILSGQGQLRGERPAHALEPGDTALVMPNEQHQFTNVGSETLQFPCAIPLSRELGGVTAQVSLYPLRRGHLGQAIEAAIDLWRSRGLDVVPGAMGTLIAGEGRALWAALRDAFTAATTQGEKVVIVTLSNACPWPPQDDKP